MVKDLGIVQTSHLQRYELTVLEDSQFVFHLRRLNFGQIFVISVGGCMT